MTAQALSWLPSMPDATPEMPADWTIPPTWIPGTPRPQGSKKAIVRKGAKHASMVESSPHVGSWRSDVRAKVEQQLTIPPLTVAVEVAVVFVFRRPNDHHIAGRRDRGLKPTAPTWCASHAAGDVDKLQRAIGDALAGIAWADDCLIVRWHDPAKLWGDSAGAWLTFRPIPEPQRW